MVEGTRTALTPEVKAMIGVAGEVVECWGAVDREYLRRFSQALMDPDPRYWDEGFARSTLYGGVVAPPIMVSYMAGRRPPREDDPVAQGFCENPRFDGFVGIGGEGSLPAIPTDLSRVLNGGNGMEIYKYPSIGDRVFFQNRYSDITERKGRDGSPFLIVTIETTFRNQNGETLCVTRSSLIRR